MATLDLIAKKALEVNSRSVKHQATAEGIESAEVRLGFLLPPLLKECYLKVGSGGFGPGYGIIGLEGGHLSDFGDIVQTYEQIRSDWQREGKQWPAGMLPICSWGCNIFSCVDCTNKDSENWPISTFEDFQIWVEPYGFDEFIQMWLEGIDIRKGDARFQTKIQEIANPFTGETAIVESRSRYK